MGENRFLDESKCPECGHPVAKHDRFGCYADDKCDCRKRYDE